MATSTITIISGASTVTLDNTISTITLGTSGPQGTPGEGVPVGGTTGQILAKDSATDYDTSWIDNFTTDVRQTIKNDSGSTLAKGTAVYVSGANGTNVLVKAALANADSTSATTIGLLYQQLANNGSGYVVTEGLLTGIDTSAATAGDPVWLSGTVPGGLLFGWANEPKAPTHIVYLGTVARAHVSLGEILVTIRNGWELDELHNVKITSPSNGQVLTYDSAQSLWVNSSETGDISAVNVTSPITGGGTSGAVTIGIDQTALAIGPSQVTGTAVITTDPRLSDARTPTAHAASHASAGSDPVTLAQSQVTNLTTDLAGKAALASANAFTVGGHTITNTVAATVPLRINGAASQTGNIFEHWQNGGANQSMGVNATGGIFTTNRVTIGLSSVSSNSRVYIQENTATIIPLVIRGAASQTANLQEWQNSAGTVLTSISSAGNITAPNSSSAISSGSFILGTDASGGRLTLVKATSTPANPGANLAKLYFRDGTTAGTLKLVVRAGAAGAETTILDNIPQ